MRESGLWRICRVWESWWPQGVSGPWRSPAPNTTPSNPPPSFHTRVRKIFPKCAPKIPWKCFHFLLEIPTPISTHILPSPFLSLPTYTSAQIIHPEYSHLTGRDGFDFSEVRCFVQASSFWVTMGGANLAAKYANYAKRHAEHFATRMFRRNLYSARPVLTRVNKMHFQTGRGGRINLASIIQNWKLKCFIIRLLLL